jgi:hypothetical protein
MICECYLVFLIFRVCFDVFMAVIVYIVIMWVMRVRVCRVRILLCCIGGLQGR